MTDYKKSLMELVQQIESEKFLRQLWTIASRHVEREKGGAVCQTTKN